MPTQPTLQGSLYVFFIICAFLSAIIGVCGAIPTSILIDKMRRDGHDKKSLILALAGILMPVIIFVFMLEGCIGFVDKNISPHFSNVLCVILVVSALGLQIASLMMKRTESSNHKVLRLMFEIFIKKINFFILLTRQSCQMLSAFFWSRGFLCTTT